MHLIQHKMWKSCRGNEGISSDLTRWHWTYCSLQQTMGHNYLIWPKDPKPTGAISQEALNVSVVSDWSVKQIHNICLEGLYSMCIICISKSREELMWLQTHYFIISNKIIHWTLIQEIRKRKAWSRLFLASTHWMAAVFPLAILGQLSWLRQELAADLVFWMCGVGQLTLNQSSTWTVSEWRTVQYHGLEWWLAIYTIQIKGGEVRWLRIAVFTEVVNLLCHVQSMH